MEIAIALLTLTFLEIVLGVDNIIFVTIVSNKLHISQRSKARNIGLLMALGFRLLLLLGIGWVISLDKQPVFNLWGIAPTVKDLILAGGGLFLLAKSTSEIHHKIEGTALEDNTEHKESKGLTAAIFQIFVLNIVFSIDSILTAIGLTNIIWVMMVAVVISVGVMIVFGAAIGNFITKHPTLEMLALSFLILIGFTLLLEGIVFVDGHHLHIPKGYIYFAVFYALMVEFINMRLRKRRDPLKLHKKME